MKHLLAGITLAVAMAVVNPVAAQVSPPGPTQLPPGVYSNPDSYRLTAPTPDDAYREGLINRWELERLVGPTPQALQGPSANGSRGFEPGN
jgi:hypothetical protein